MIGASSFFTLEGTSSGLVMIADASAVPHSQVRTAPMRDTASAIVFCAVTAFSIRFAKARSGSSKTYTFFVEAITKGSADKGGRCPDGTMTIARQGDDLALGWFGTVQGTTVVAYGTLKKK